MPVTSKYFVTSTVSGQNWLDFNLSIEHLTLLGQEIIFYGTNSIDAVRVGPGIIFDFTLSRGGRDNLFLSGNSSDYSISVDTSTVTLERGHGAAAEKVIVGVGSTQNNSDNIVFANGTANAFDVHAYGTALAAGTTASLPLSAALTPPSTLSATVKAFALDAKGEVFAPSSNGINYIIYGSNAIDYVYVNPGSTVDATQLRGGIDEIYFTGRWQDYTKAVFDSALVFTSSAGDHVTVAAGSGSLNDRLIFSDGTVRSNDAKQALSNQSVAISAVAGFDATRTTPGLSPRISSSSLDDLDNLDVRSAIVLNVSQSVTPVSGRFIRIVDDGGAGFRGENTVRTQTISVTDTTQVTVQGGLIIVRPAIDLDLASNYHVEIDENAFVNAAGRGNAALNDPTAINFSTVTPGSGAVSAAAASRSMNTDTGSLQESFAWLDIEGVGSPSSQTGVVLDLGVGNIALVFKDYDSAGGDADQAIDGIGAPDFYVRAINFGTGDLIYIDNQNPDAPNLLSEIGILANQPTPGVSTIPFGPPSEGGLGAVLEIDIVGTTDSFNSWSALKALMGINYDPVGEDVRAALPDTTPPTLQYATVSTDGRTITLTFSEALDTAAANSAQLLSRFSVSAGSTSNWSFESAQVQGSTVVLTTPSSNPIPRPANLSPSTVLVSYTDLTAGNDATGVVQDFPAGNDLATFSGFAAVNNSTYEPLAPAPVIQGLTAANIASEGTSITYTVTLSGPAPAGGFVVDWRVVPHSSGDPAEPGDFGTSAPLLAFPSGSITIPQGASSGQITLPIFDDDLAEGDEAFRLQVGKAEGVAGFTIAVERETTILASDQGDTTAPTLQIQALGTDKFLADTFYSISFKFSEPVTGFDLGDVVVTGGTLDYFYESGGYYSAVFKPTAGFDGVSTFSVAAGAFADLAGNLSTAPAQLSVQTRTVQPTNSGATSFTTPTAQATSDVLVRFSEPIFENVPGASLFGLSLVLNPSAANGFQGSFPSPSITSFTLDSSGQLLTLRTNATFSANDVVRVRIDNFTSFRDADGNGLQAQEIYIGGNGANTIDLERYSPWYASRQILRGNGGNDTLVGTYNADTLIDGGGADVLDGLRGGDFFVLVENDSTGSNPIPNAKDTIVIGLGDSRRGFGNTDVIAFDAANSNSGFDWSSTDTTKHDVLNLESALIGNVQSFAITPAPQGVIINHTVVNGIVTFLDSGGSAITIRQDNPSLGNALDYLRFNLQAPGYTVAFKADYNNNGAVESLFVYQDMGVLPLRGNFEMPDIVVRIELPEATAGARLASVTLGNIPGLNVLQIQDDFSPEPWAIALTASGVTFNFVEPVYGPSSGASALAMSLQVNGAGTVYTPTSLTGEGTTVLTVQSSGLNLEPSDWALVTYGGTNAGNAFRDTAGNFLTAHDDDSGPTTHTFVLGSSGDNVIDLSARTVSGWGLDVEAGAGDDRVIGTMASDWILAGKGADTLTGGGGGDEFEFEQGDSPVVTVNLTGVVANSYLLTGATYTFAGGKPEVITDFGAGDAVYLYPYLDGLTGSRWLYSPYSSASGMNGNAPTGLPEDQTFKVLQGDLGDNGVFTVGMDYSVGEDLLVLYDGDGSADVSATAFVLQGVTMGDIESLYGGGNSIRSNKPVDNGGGGGGGGGEGNPQGTATVVFQQSVSIDDLIDATIFDDTSTAQITSTMLTVVSGDGLASVRLIGSDLTWTPLADGDFALTGGTITRAEFDAGATAGALSPAVVLSGLAINAVVLDAAVDEAWDTNLQDTSAFDALLDAYQYDITGTAASERLEGSQWDDTLRGGGGGDTLVGWEGDDVLIVGSNAAGFEYGLVSPGTGNDTIDYAAVVTGDHLLSYEFQPAGVDLSIDGVNKVGSVLKGSSGQWEDTLLGVDKLLNVANHPTVAGSAQILGSAHADTFEINLAGNQWISIRGLAGSDTFEFAGNGWTRLDYILSPDGVDVNLAQGKAYDDGYGTQDTITGKVNELRGSNSSDKLIGSDGDESFIPRGGNDTIEGGGGFDRVRYDQGNVTDLEVDLLDGRATGFHNGVAFVHQLSGIEHVRGSNQADFLLSGTGSVRLEGRGGADEFLIDDGGQVRIDDFVIGQDVLILDAGVTLAQAQAALAAAQAVTVSGSPGAKVTFNAETSVTFRGLSVEQVAGIVPVIEQDGGDSPWAPVFTDLSASGYTSTAAFESLFFDPTVLTLGNIQLVDAPATDSPAKVLIFDLILDLTDPDVQAIDPLGVIVQFGGDLDGVLDAFAFSPSSWSLDGEPVPYWEFNYSDLAAHGRLYASPYGIAEFETDPQIYEQNPLAEAYGRVGQVRVLLDGEVIEPPQISVEDLIVFPIDWLSGTAPVMMVEVMESSQVQIAGLTDDNLLKYFVDYDEISDKTHLKAMFDEDPDLNQVQPSDLIELTFPGDVSSSLVPASLTFSS